MKTRLLRDGIMCAITVLALAVALATLPAVGQTTNGNAAGTPNAARQQAGTNPGDNPNAAASPNNPNKPNSANTASTNNTAGTDAPASNTGNGGGGWGLWGLVGLLGLLGLGGGRRKEVVHRPEDGDIRRVA